jgi:hypothetical protein
MLRAFGKEIPVGSILRLLNVIDALPQDDTTTSPEELLEKLQSVMRQA